MEASDFDYRFQQQSGVTLCHDDRTLFGTKRGYLLSPCPCVLRQQRRWHRRSQSPRLARQLRFRERPSIASTNSRDEASYTEPTWQRRSAAKFHTGESTLCLGSRRTVWQKIK